MDKIKSGIIVILRRWSKMSVEFGGIWSGYDHLREELIDIGIVKSMAMIKKAMKELSIEKKVEFKPTYDSDNMLNGSGWFLCD